jgi:signal peptidase I
MLLSALRVTRIGFRAAWLAGVLALVALTLLPAALRATGFDTYTVRGGSMSPGIPLGSFVVVQRVSADSVNAGDVITFKAPNNTVVTHRVLGRTADAQPTFITQGDANPSPDPDMVSSAAVIGRVVFSVPVAGAAIVALSTLGGIVVAASLLVMLMLAGWFIDEWRAMVAGPSNRRAATELAG